MKTLAVNRLKYNVAVKINVFYIGKHKPAIFFLHAATAFYKYVSFFKKKQPALSKGCLLIKKNNWQPKYRRI